MDIGPGGYHAGSGLQGGDNLGHSLGGAGSQRNDGLAALGQLGPAHEIQLAARSGIDAGADGIGTDLAGKVYLDGRIDGHHPGVLRNHARVVGVGNIQHLHLRIVVYEGIDLLGAQQERGHHLPLVDAFVFSVNDPALNEGQGAVREHFRMEAQVLMALEGGTDGIGHGADSHLQAGPVRDQFCTDAANLKVCFRGGGILLGDERTAVLHQGRETLQGDQIAKGKGNIRIDHGNTLPGHVQGRQGAVDGRTQRHHPVFRLRHLHHSHIAGQGPGAVHGLGFVKIDGDIIRQAFLHVPAHIGAYKKALVKEGTTLRVRGVSLRMEVMEVDVLQF